MDKTKGGGPINYDVFWTTHTSTIWPDWKLIIKAHSRLGEGFGDWQILPPWSSCVSCRLNIAIAVAAHIWDHSFVTQQMTSDHIWRNTVLCTKEVTTPRPYFDWELSIWLRHDIKPCIFWEPKPHQVVENKTPI